MEEKDYYQYDKIDGSDRLTVLNPKFLTKFDPPECKLEVVSLI